MPPKTAASSLALVIELAKESPARLHDVIQFHRRRSFEAIEVTHVSIYKKIQDFEEDIGSV
ncbi:uncharacterized protein N7458_007124 [Penicillium daleae]|uniref:Uncharacterized protein n=1 Tax=Penicillium daleae TaxID=63821 RepID=A0AAD6C644_9EURO|nr:uncharacterized protein N7458_007124 [Penicillium daleae]KAJ5450675.1 hypothetical protein N7458_007124 [Penicillium daleae]